MSESRTSSARRVYRILRAAESVPKGVTTNVAWAIVFGLAKADSPPATGKINDKAVAALLSDFADEVEAVRQSLSIDPETAQASKAAIDHALELASLSHLHGAWQDRRGHLAAEVLMAWQWISIHLPSEPEFADPAALDQLRQEIQELEEASRQPGIPPDVRRFVLRQVEALKSALQRVSVAGVEPLRSALSRGIGEIVQSGEDLQASTEGSPESKGLVRRLGNVWGKAAQVADDVEKLQKAALILVKGAPYVAKALEYIDKVLEG